MGEPLIALIIRITLGPLIALVVLITLEKPILDTWDSPIRNNLVPSGITQAELVAGRAAHTACRSPNLP